LLAPCCGYMSKVWQPPHVMWLCGPGWIAGPFLFGGGGV
jgi:hypothetical protein